MQGSGEKFISRASLHCRYNIERYRIVARTDDTHFAQANCNMQSSRFILNILWIHYSVSTISDYLYFHFCGVDVHAATADRAAPPPTGYTSAHVNTQCFLHLLFYKFFSPVRHISGSRAFPIRAFPLLLSAFFVPPPPPSRVCFLCASAPYHPFCGPCRDYFILLVYLRSTILRAGA